MYGLQMLRNSVFMNLVLALTVIGLSACQKEAAEPTSEEEGKTAAPAAAAAKADTVVKIKDVGFKTPESVLYEHEQDIYFVSNINGSPLDTDGNGFISKVSPDGQVLELKWIDGTKEGVTLNAPKGMAVTGDWLYIADITHVRRFDRKTGAPKGDIEIPGATFVNDVVAAKDGTIYVSDSGLKKGDKGFAPSETDAVWRIASNGKPEPMIKNKDLGRPNGLAIDNGEVMVVTFGSGEIFRINKENEKVDVRKAPKGSLDGLQRLDNGDLLFSSWDAKAVYKMIKGGKFESVIEDVDAPADIGFDTKRKRVLIPLFNDDAVVLAPL